MRVSVALLLIAIAPSLVRADDRVLDWVRVNEKAPWRARDSSGEMVFKDKLWILGGWFDSFHAPPRDVWSSPDGKPRIEFWWTLAGSED